MYSSSCRASFHVNPREPRLDRKFLILGEIHHRRPWADYFPQTGKIETETHAGPLRRAFLLLTKGANSDAARSPYRNNGLQSVATK